MTEHVQQWLHILKSGSYKAFRYQTNIVMPSEAVDLSWAMQDAYALRQVLQNEKLYLHPEDRMGFNRGNTTVQYTAADGTRRASGIGNMIPDYPRALEMGLDTLREEVVERLATCPLTQSDFLRAVLVALDAAIELADRAALQAKKEGANELSAALARVPRKPAKTLHEACVFMKFLIFTLKCNRNVHIPLGRFDQYMRRYYYADLQAGKTREELLEIIEEFFISLNFDGDLYAGVQTGDNGQSLVLGGSGSFDDFSHLCMEASLELNLIDPKINLRVDKTTPDELYEFATQMTRQGMGFPQYCNDDVVIPGLVALGYAPEDAADYAVAACWEYIIPGKGADVPNIRTLNFPKVVNKAVFSKLEQCADFNALLERVKVAIRQECDLLMEDCRRRRPYPSPYLSLFIQNCIADGTDVAFGGSVYNNYGFHGAGIATAADSLAAIREVVFEKEEYTKAGLLEALEKNFEGFGPLRNRLLGCPKMGNGDPSVDRLGYELLETFGAYLNGKPNPMGGIYRAGTGSAMEYWFSAQTVGATADGRRAAQPYGCSFSPSLEARLQGPLSCIRSFTGMDLKQVINGGPLTMELHDTVFRNPQGIQKVARLVKAFVALGGHQLQLNCICREKLLDAIAHPEDHKNLIVRVWGWSGYFNELDDHFKQHILKRTEFTV